MPSPDKKPTKKPTPKKTDKFSQRDKAPPKPRIKKVPPVEEIMVDLNLRVKHNINGNQFGPGAVTVNSKVAKVLMDGETRVLQEEIKFHTGRGVIVSANQGDMKRPPTFMHGDLFQETLARLSR